MDYFKNILDDYKTVAIETVTDMKARPVKSSFYISLITGAVVLIKTRPTETDFDTQLIDHSQDLMLVSDMIRNPGSESFVKKVSTLKSEGRLKYVNLLVCALLRETNYSSELGIYEANCKYIKPHWTEFHKTIVDVGLFGKWFNLNEAMKDYDINPQEWKEDGTLDQDFQFYKKSLVTWDMKM